MIRSATRHDVPAVTALVNEAFVVEAFFKIGDRTTSAEIGEMMRDGEFLVLESPEGVLEGCVYVTTCADRSYFGMLSVAPASQGRRLGQRLVAAAEDWAAARGSRYMDIHIVNLREELPGYYERLGYAQGGILPFSHPERASRPCHFIVMTKVLRGR